MSWHIDENDNVFNSQKHTHRMQTKKKLPEKTQYS